MAAQGGELDGDARVQEGGSAGPGGGGGRDEVHRGKRGPNVKLTTNLEPASTSAAVCVRVRRACRVCCVLPAPSHTVNTYKRIGA